MDPKCIKRISLVVFLNAHSETITCKIILHLSQIKRPLFLFGMPQVKIRGHFPFQNIMKLPKLTIENKFCSKPFIVMR